jgi:hypothetical protein
MELKPSRCGVCNYDIPINHACYHRIEEDMTITSYHVACKGKLENIKPCLDCGKHRLLCDECKE